MAGAAWTVSVPAAVPVPPAALKRLPSPRNVYVIGYVPVARPALLNVAEKLPPAPTAIACVTPLSVTATSSPPGDSVPAVMRPLTVTVFVPTLTAGEDRLLNVG